LRLTANPEIVNFQDLQEMKSAMITSAIRDAISWIFLNLVPIVYNQPTAHVKFPA